MNTARAHPMLDICLPQISPQQAVPCFLPPTGSCDFNQVIGSPCRGPIHAATFSTRSPLQNFTTLSVISPESNVPRPLPLNKTGNSSGYVVHLGSSVDLLIFYSIAQRDSEHSPLIAFWETLSLLIMPVAIRDEKILKTLLSRVVFNN